MDRTCVSHYLHPDDVDFGAAGTIANLTDLDATVTYCIVTDGQAGGLTTQFRARKWHRFGGRSKQRRASLGCLTWCSSVGWMEKSKPGSNFDTTFCESFANIGLRSCLLSLRRSTFAGFMRAIPTILLLLNRRSLRCARCSQPVCVYRSHHRRFRAVGCR